MPKASFSVAMSASNEYDPTIEDCYYVGLPPVESQVPTAMV